MIPILDEEVKVEEYGSIVALL